MPSRFETNFTPRHRGYPSLISTVNIFSVNSVSPWLSFLEKRGEYFLLELRVSVVIIHIFAV